jgi:hypothetical protein
MQKKIRYTAGDELLLSFHARISKLTEVRRAIAPVKRFEERYP